METAICGNYHFVTGKVYNDLNTNGTWEEGIDLPLPNASISAEGNNNTYFSNDNGQYQIRLESGVREVTVHLPYGQWLGNPTIDTLTITDQDTIVNFGFQALPSDPTASVNFTLPS